MPLSPDETASVLRWVPPSSARSGLPGLATGRPHSAAVLANASDPVPGSKQRTRIWDLHHSLHCSIIGTCLTTTELRRLLIRLNVDSAESADEHAVHQLGVVLATRPQAGAKHLQKVLDRKHKQALARFAKSRDSQGVLGLWEGAVKSGDIPGAYWAALTHPATTEAVVKRVFGEVHMLSHLVGAANRADIRRLRELEQERAALVATVERQQRLLRDGFVSREETIRRLNDALARKAGENVSTAQMHSDAQALNAVLAHREKRLADEVRRRERLEALLRTIGASHAQADRARDLVERERNALRDELASIERQLSALLAGEDRQPDDSINLNGRCVLYVGGRAHQTARMKALVERTNGRFLHHDGGLEHSAALLPGLVSRADCVMFPVDCISHEAAGIIKRTCRQSGKRYLPLRSSSLTSLLSGLANVPPTGILSAEEGAG